MSRITLSIITLMKTTLKTGAPSEYLVDRKGKPRAVVIDIESYKRMMEDFDDLRVLAERRDNPKIDALRFITRLKKHGIL
jgi:PHD/YefM family antitoxin component YafN of YafNO toxin-antitoxin module